MSKEEAVKLIDDCMRVLFYRDKKAADKVQICTVTKDGVNIEPEHHVESEWSLQSFQFRTNEYWRPMRLQEKEIKYGA